MGRLQKNPKRVKEVEKQVWGKSYHMISCMINNRFLERKNETCGFVTILKKKGKHTSILLAISWYPLVMICALLAKKAKNVQI